MMISNWNKRVLTVVGLIGLMSAILFFGFRQHPSSFDDAYITYRYAQNLAMGRGFVYNIGESVLGTTTPLYALLLAALSFIWPHIPLLSHAVSVLAWMLSIPLICGIGQIGKRERVGMVAAALIATNALFLNVLGMETTFYLLLILSTFYLYLKDKPIWAALFAALAFLTRWDGVLVGGVLLFAESLKFQKNRLLRGSLVYFSLAVPWLLYSYLTFGSIFPNTLFAKLGQGWNEGLGAGEIGSFGLGLWQIASSAYASNPLFLFWPIFAVLGLFSAFHRKVKWWPLLLWTAAYIAGYVALGVLRFSWYYPPVVPALALLTGEGIETVAKSISFRFKLRLPSGLFVVILCTLCLIPNIDWLVKSQRTEIDPHSATYVEVGQWLQAHTPQNSSVALIEIGIIGFYSDRTVVDTMGLVSPDMVGHLGNWFQTVQFAVNYYWPDYVVALEKTAWVNIVQEEWFREAYILETEILNSNDPVAPVRIYSRRSGFPPRKFVLNSQPKVQFDSRFVLHQIQLAEDRVAPGDNLHVQLTWEATADIHTKYRFQFDLLNTSDQQSRTLASALQPMRGGNPTTQWRKGDEIVDRHLLAVPTDIPAGSYLLRLIVTPKEGEVVMSDLTGNSVDDIVAGPIQIGQGLVVVREPTFPIASTFADHISLEGFDLDETISGNNLLITLYWQATAPISTDYTVFVHLLSPEGELVAQHDSAPLLPTSSWIPGTQVIDMHRLALPAEPTHYQIRVGLYHWPDLERVPIVASGCLDATNNVLLLGDISFKSSPRPTGLSCPDAYWILK